MSLRLIITALVGCTALVACAPKEAPPPATPEPEPVKVDEWTPQSPQPAWWSEKPPCPDDAVLVGAPPPEGNVLQCRKPNGVNHGFASVWFPNGHEGTLTQYNNGLRHGLWMHWLHGRKMIEGEYNNGRKHGNWIYWFDENSDFDEQGRMKSHLPIVLEEYNNGMVVSRERRGHAPPEKVSAEGPHEAPPPKGEEVTVHTGQPAPPAPK